MVFEILIDETSKSRGWTKVGTMPALGKMPAQWLKQ